MNDERKLQLLPVVDKTYGTVTIAGYDKVTDDVLACIKSNSTFIDPKDDLELKLCKEERTNINNKLKALQRQRIDVVNYLTGEFSEQCKELEKLLKDAYTKHTEAINKSKPSKAKPVELKLSCPNENIRARVIEFANSLGCEVKERKKGEVIEIDE